ncbi:Olfactory receptor 14A2 [Lemmus lemmus]
MANVTAVSGFIFTGISDVQELQTLCGVFFLVMYMAALTSNLIIITLITLDLQLQTPMYFFLKNLSLLDVFFVSVTIPNLVVNSLTHNNFISILGCAVQVFLLSSFSAGEVFILTAMSYDRFVAICSPLHYDAIMNGVTFVVLVCFSWTTGVFFGALYTAGIFSGPFCGSNVIPQFFCDVPSLLRISCSERLVLIYTGGEVFVLTAMSYDRYVAICSPLHYDAIMNGGTCVLMVGVSWATGIYDDDDDDDDDNDGDEHQMKQYRSGKINTTFVHYA